MIETVEIPNDNPHVWTCFWDMHSGGYPKIKDYTKIYIQAPMHRSIDLFIEQFNQRPDDVACDCCGPNFSVSEGDSLALITAYHRRVTIHDDGTETMDGGWAGPGSVSMKLTDYCQRDDVLVIYTRERGEEI